MFRAPVGSESKFAAQYGAAAGTLVIDRDASSARKRKREYSQETQVHIDANQKVSSFPTARMNASNNV
jgi:hypothetical protein